MSVSGSRAIGEMAGVEAYFVVPDVRYPNLFGLTVEWGIPQVMNVGSV